MQYAAAYVSLFSIVSAFVSLLQSKQKFISPHSQSAFTKCKSFLTSHPAATGSVHFPANDSLFYSPASNSRAEKTSAFILFLVGCAARNCAAMTSFSPRDLPLQQADHRVLGMTKGKTCAWLFKAITKPLLVVCHDIDSLNCALCSIMLMAISPRHELHQVSHGQGLKCSLFQGSAFNVGFLEQYG